MKKICKAKKDGSQAQRGVALIITLIMLSVITFMAVTFLVLSQRERNAVTTTTDQALARFAADTGLERAKIELLAPMLAFTNSQLYDLIVSTNYRNPYGYDTLATNSPPFGINPTNVNYDYTFDGSAFTPDERRQNIANLLLNPRPPVVVTNRVLGTNEFRYYLDLNRNGRFDTNGWIPELGANGLPIVIGTVTNYVWCVGDPEWIGVLEHPERPHSSSNRFIGRYAYIVAPAGKTLDWNYIHNAAKRFNPTPGVDNFLRNQGVGSWEINLAGFLADLNTNYWYYDAYAPGAPVYNYVTNTIPPNDSGGIAFEDASRFLGFRYPLGNFNFLDSFQQRYGANAAYRANFGGVDEYSDGNLQTGLALPFDADSAILPWSGSDNTNHFFTSQELFDRSKVSLGLAPLVPGFTNRLIDAGTNLSTYDRYTYYRMMGQIGLGTTPERGKINVNLRNVDDFGHVIPGMETNFFAWTNASVFFTNAVDRLLRMNTETWHRENNYDYTNTYGINAAFGLNAAQGGLGIPVYVPFQHLNTNLVTVDTDTAIRYTAGIHRLLQVVANIYDATTNRSDLTAYPNLPHVYRPIFRRITTNGNDYIYIVAYREVRDAQIAGVGGPGPKMIDPQLAANSGSQLGRSEILEMGTPYNTSSSVENDEPMVYGIPLIVGAKKGLPSFNKFGLQSDIRVTRKLQFRRQPLGPVNETNQVYELSVSNSFFGAQAWNSYAATLNRPIQAIVAAEIIMSLTNQFGSNSPGSMVFRTHTLATPAAPLIYPNWPGYIPSVGPASFKIPVFTNSLFLTNSFYVQDATPAGTYFAASSQDALWDQGNTFRLPHFYLNQRTRLRFILVDTSVNRIVDYVNLDASEPPLDIMKTLLKDAKCDQVVSSKTVDAAGVLWCTNRVDDPLGTQPDSPARANLLTQGILNQILISLGTVTATPTLWKDFSLTPDKESSIDRFKIWFTSTNTPNSWDAPYQPTRKIYRYVSWEANDPLVHYTVSDLTDLLIASEKFELDNATASTTNNMAGPNRMNRRYLPWPRKAADYSTTPQTQFETSLKDPGVIGSDSWNFPVSMLPNIGWLGRVHRGTPWQTIYMKSEDLSVTNFPTPLTNAIAWGRYYHDPAVRWITWSGNQNTNEAFYARPVQDRLLFDVFTSAINDNATRGQLSVNQSGLAAWSAILSGVVVTTNVNGGAATIQPAALGPRPGWNVSDVEWIVNGINRTRSQTNLMNGDLYPQKQFSHLGDILSVPELTENSPFINTNNLQVVNKVPISGGISDEVMERIPQQIMSLLTLNPSPRFVIYAYGQTLHPAPNSIVTVNGPHFQLCTNYQVTAEAVTRTVLRLDGFNPTNNRPQMVTEQFNPLPPD